MKLILTIAIIFCSITGYSQVKDTLKIHSPKKATIKSALLPGLGQAYNKKWWKIPIIYGAIGGLIYSGHVGHTNFILAETAFKEVSKGSTISINKYNNSYYTSTVLAEEMRYYSRNRDFSYILLGLSYILNILDANVDAHLIDYNVSDNLSLKIEPSIERNAYIGINNGIKVGMRF